MSRKIYCNKCKVYLGEIRDAKLRKDVCFSCYSCVSKNKNSHTTNKNEMPDFMKNLFGKFT